jgi:hypothetical protein
MLIDYLVATRASTNKVYIFVDTALFGFYHIAGNIALRFLYSDVDKNVYKMYRVLYILTVNSCACLYVIWCKYTDGLFISYPSPHLHSIHLSNHTKKGGNFDFSLCTCSLFLFRLVSPDANTLMAMPASLSHRTFGVTRSRSVAKTRTPFVRERCAARIRRGWSARSSYCSPGANESGSTEIRAHVQNVAVIHVHRGIYHGRSCGMIFMPLWSPSRTSICETQ